MVHVLIPAHNNRNEVLAVLDCLAAQTYKPIRIVLVDDGSTDGTGPEARKRHPDTVILEGDGNLWWAGANALGVEHILKEARDGDFVLLLNNDLTVDDDFVAVLVQGSLAHGRALVGSALFDFDSRAFIESGVRTDERLRLQVNTDAEKMRNEDFDMDVSVLPGRGTLVPVEAFLAAGNFNARKMPHYCADYEFSVRARRAGFKLIVSHRARVYAKVGITGIPAPTGQRIMSLRECYELLFSRKSRMNIIYYSNYVWLCSEKAYRLENVANFVKSMLEETLLKTAPFLPVALALRGLSSMRRGLGRLIRGCQTLK